MRSLRMVVVIVLFALFAAAPQIGRWVTTANASAAPATAGQVVVNAPANDNADEDCNSGNPRKEKKCHFNASNTDNDNTGGNGGLSDQPPGGAIALSTSDPNRGDTVFFAVTASGNRLDKVWWWIPDFPNDDNDNEDHNEND